MFDVGQKREVVICAGVGGTGKSTFALRYLLNADFSARFLFDPEGEFSRRLYWPGAQTGFELTRQLALGWVVFDPHAMFPGRLTDALRFFCEWAFEMCARLDGRKVLVVDEVWKYCTPQAIPPELATVVQTGRKRGLGLVVNTQRPNRLNGAILNEISELVCFRLQFGPSLDLMQQHGFAPERVRALADLQFISRALDTGGELAGKISF